MAAFHHWRATRDTLSRNPPGVPPLFLPSPQTPKLQTHGQCWVFTESRLSTSSSFNPQVKPMTSSSRLPSPVVEEPEGQRG